MSPVESEVHALVKLQRKIEFVKAKQKCACFHSRARHRTNYSLTLTHN